jgi:hypothetical protein
MKRAIALFGLALLVVGCGDKDGKPAADGQGSAQTTGKPPTDEAKACIVTYLNQCGWKDVELASIADQPEVPAGAKAGGEAWAFAFTAHYTNLFGERQSSENWLAVVGRTDGKPCVTSCFDETRHLVGGHTGAESNEKGKLVASGPAEDLPPIVAPKP